MPDLAERIGGHVRALSADIGARPVGSAANQRAEEYIARAFAAEGYDVEWQAFDCADWTIGPVELQCDGEQMPCLPNPHSSPCDVRASTVAATSLDELMAADLRGKVALLSGALTAEPVFPKNFRFLRLDEQQRLMQRLEQGGAAAVVAVSPQTRRVEPIFEDGDFTVPAVTVDAEVGERLLARRHSAVSLRIASVRRPSRGANVIARRAGASGRRLAACAHLDTKPGTPGALDNAAGVAAILALAEALTASPPAGLGLEFIAFNGEDHYSAAGQVAYLDAFAATFGDIALLMNFDGLGHRGARTTAALMGCPDALAARVRARLRGQPGLVETEPWPQSDHFMFWQAGVPCLAFTSEDALALVQTVIHTPADALDIVDPAAIAAAVACAAEVVGDLAQA